MKKFLFILLCIIILLTGIAVILNINVTTRQGINFQWHTIKIPLYLKVLDFFDRHYNYKQLVKNIVRGAKTEEERVMKIFEWTHNNIRKIPNGYPIIDDHVWHIIVRGYGAIDQSSDVFTTLCNYAGVDAFFLNIPTENRSSRISLSFVRLNKRWRIFDPYNGVYFKNKNGVIASIDEIKSNNWRVENIGGVDSLDFDYKRYLINLPTIKNIGLSRPSIQSPLRRIIFEVKRWIKIK